MTLTRPRIWQIVWLVVAAALIVGAAALQGVLARQSREYEIVPPGDIVAAEHPEIKLLQMAPGGLRAPLVNYLWIRAEKLKQAGRYYDAMQRAQLICALQPHFPGVWIFHSWNMAWNISVTTHTADERWLWVTRGMRLLRDEAIPLNPHSLELYRELAWIFFFKMGETTDEMHYAYKQRWAAQMQRLLGSPPYASADEVVEWFRPVADPAFLDKDPLRKGDQAIQDDKLEELYARDPRVGEYADRLASENVEVGDGLLEAWNRFSTDPSASRVRLVKPRADDATERRVQALINDESYADARNTLLAFVRAQLLWNTYKLDPQWMLQLMEVYGPLDWRMVQSHGLYWVLYGLHVVKDLSLEGLQAYMMERITRSEEREVALMNTNRIVLNNLKTLTWTGRMTYVQNPGDPTAPQLSFSSDWRFVEPTQREYVRLINSILAERGGVFEDTALRASHMNYLVEAIQMLYAGYHRRHAERHFTWLKENYKPRGEEWDLPLGQFVVAKLNEEGRPIRSRAISQISASLQAAFVQLARRNEDGYRESLAYARRVHDIYQRGAAERNRLDSFTDLATGVFIYVLAEPWRVGFHLDLIDRVHLYNAIGAKWPELQLRAHALVVRPPQGGPMDISPLEAQCRMAGLDFDKAFPSPPGWEEYLEQLQRRIPADRGGEGAR